MFPAPLLLLSLGLLAGPANAALTQEAVYPNGDAIRQNANGTWCFFPAEVKEAAETSCNMARDLGAAMEAQRNASASINYFGGDGARLGGPEWVFDAAESRAEAHIAEPRVFLCASGLGAEGKGRVYRTVCSAVTADDEIMDAEYEAEGHPACTRWIAQWAVDDGCYPPDEKAEAWDGGFEMHKYSGASRLAGHLGLAAALLGVSMISWLAPL